MVPYIELLIKNGLAERVEGEIVRYRAWSQRGETAATAPSGAGIGTLDHGGVGFTKNRN